MISPSLALLITTIASLITIMSLLKTVYLDSDEASQPKIKNAFSKQIRLISQMLFACNLLAFTFVAAQTGDVSLFAIGLVFTCSISVAVLGLWFRYGDRLSRAGYTW
jgi:hypothetical protein